MHLGNVAFRNLIGSRIFFREACLEVAIVMVDGWLDRIDEAEYIFRAQKAQDQEGQKAHIAHSRTNRYSTRSGGMQRLPIEKNEPWQWQQTTNTPLIFGGWRETDVGFGL